MIKDIDIPDFLNEEADDIHDRMLDLAPLDISTVEGDIFWDTTRPTAEEIAKLKQIDLREQLKQAFPQTSTGKYLEMHGETKNVFKHKATKSKGVVTFYGKDETYIPKGTVVGTIATKDLESIEFETEEDGFIKEGKLELNVIALEEGSEGNVIKHSIVLVNDEIDGLEKVDNLNDFRNGADIEDEEKFRERVIEAFGNENLSGAPKDYKRWAKSVDGVGNAYVIPEWDGPGTVKLLVVDAKGKPVGEEILKKVRVFILDKEENGKNTGNGVAPIGADVTISSPEIESLRVSVNVVIDDAFSKDEVREKIVNYIEGYLSSLKIQDQVIYKAIDGILGSMIINNEGITDYSNLLLNGKTENIILDYKVPYLEEVILN